jgi:hypothetical protein
MVRWAWTHLAGEALAGALPVVPWQLLQMRRAQLLQRARCYGTLGTGTSCGRGAGRRTPCVSLAAADETSAAAEGTVCGCVGHGHTVR